MRVVSPLNISCQKLLGRITHRGRSALDNAEIGQLQLHPLVSLRDYQLSFPGGDGIGLIMHIGCPYHPNVNVFAFESSDFPSANIAWQG